MITFIRKAGCRTKLLKRTVLWHMEGTLEEQSGTHSVEFSFNGDRHVSIFPAMMCDCVCEAVAMSELS